MLASLDLEIATALVGAVASLLASLVSGLFSSIAKRVEDRMDPTVLVVLKDSAEPGPPKPNYDSDTRLIEARSELRRQETSANWYRRSATSLAISQYVVGGTLATSFVQSSLPDGAVGFLGLVVLLSSIIYQRFRPDLHTSAARRRVAQLRATIRRAEDGLYLHREGLPGAPTIQQIRVDITEALEQIERSELEDNFLPLPSTTEQGNNRGDSISPKLVD